MYQKAEMPQSAAHEMALGLAATPCRNSPPLRAERRPPSSVALGALPSFYSASLQGHDDMFPRPRVHAQWPFGRCQRHRDAKCRVPYTWLLIPRLCPARRMDCRTIILER